MAARASIGLQVVEGKYQQINLTQLRKRQRNKLEKTSGRKRPRLYDVDVVAAGDAEPEIAEQLIASVGIDLQSSPNATAAGYYGQ